MKQQIDYSMWFENKYFPCPICENKREIRISEKGKPYIVCEPCGVQLFVRTHDGIIKMRNKLDWQLW